MLVKQINVVSIVRGEEEKGGDLRDAACCPLLSTYDLGTHLSYDSCIFFHASPIRPLLAQPTLLRACHGGWVGGCASLTQTGSASTTILDFKDCIPPDPYGWLLLIS